MQSKRVRNDKKIFDNISFLSLGKNKSRAGKFKITFSTPFSDKSAQISNENSVFP